MLAGDDKRGQVINQVGGQVVNQVI